jgi:hypothetical protein
MAEAPSICPGIGLIYDPLFYLGIQGIFPETNKKNAEINRIVPTIF